MSARLSPAALAAATPVGRDRVVDLIRAVALLVVVAGHWTMSVVSSSSGGIETSNLLVEAPASQWATWGLQVMPLFFVVGGYANAASLASAARRGTGWSQWVRGRAVRLLRPAVPLLGAWVVLLGALHAAGFDPTLLRLATLTSTVPLWFLATYLMVIALAPPLLAAHRRLGLVVPIAMVAAAVGVDVLARAGLPAVGYVNFLFVWGALHQLGFAWFDGRLLRSRSTRWLLLGGGLVALVGLVSVASYPVSMVGVPGAPRSNNSPPTVALVALGLIQTGAVLIARDRLNRWLSRPRVWAAVIVAGSVSMTVYLWHFTVMVLVTVAVVPTGLFPEAAPLSAGWWLLRPLWLAVNAAALLPVVRLLAPVERHAAALAGTVPAGRIMWTAAGAALACAAIAFTVTTGLYAPGRALPLRVELVAAFVLGLALLGGIGRTASSSTSIRVLGSCRPTRL